MKIRFKDSTHLCYDGVNIRKYDPALVYEPTHAHEKLMFQAALDKGEAVFADAAIETEDKPKISTPKSKKA
jgi:chloramphenicol 3-O-phosphotransferase